MVVWVLECRKSGIYELERELEAEDNKTLNIQNQSSGINGAFIGISHWNNIDNNPTKHVC